LALNIHIFTRRVKVRPIDRIRTDNFLTMSPLGELVWGTFMGLYSLIFVLGWNFPFPSKSERILWNISSLAMLCYCTFGAIFFYYCDHAYCRNWGSKETTLQLFVRLFRQLQRSSSDGERAANIETTLPDKFPKLPIRALIPCLVISAVYCIARAYILLEDVIGLRSLPSSAFQTVNWTQHLPHL
jgi:hypothetical protein